MKYLSVIVFSLFFCGMLSCKEKETQQAKKQDRTTQEGVPVIVAEAFKEKYPDEKNPDWERDANGYWEAHYKKDGEKYRADFTPEGSWIETENSIDKADLPDAVKKTIEEKYPDREITEVEYVVSSREGNFYDVEFKQEDKNMDVEIKEDGTVITVEQ